MTNEIKSPSSGDTEPLVKEIILNASIQKVWKAITDKDEMKNWYFELDEFKPEVGFEFQFYGETESCRYLHLCKVTEVITEKKITYSWKYDGYSGNSHVTFELFKDGDKTRLKLTHDGAETIPNDVPDLSKENFLKGWDHIIDISLKEYLEK